jgi:hypothetical protein
MAPDSFKTQLQAVLTSYYEDVKGIQGASGCPKPKFVKRRFEDPEDAESKPEDDATSPTLDLAAAPADRGSSPRGSPRGTSFQLLLLNGPQPSRKGGGMGPEE